MTDETNAIDFARLENVTLNTEWQNEREKKKWNIFHEKS